MFPAYDVGPPDDPLVQKFWAFHEENPHVYDNLKRKAIRLKRRGFEHWGIGGLFEVLRWQQAMKTTERDFKLNNNHRAFYARLLMLREAYLEGFFEVRSSVADTAKKQPVTTP
jgi:hypothetical protein